MINTQIYKDWSLPYIIKDPEWDAFITALSEEIVLLKKNQMGAYNKSGFSDVTDLLEWPDGEGWKSSDLFIPSTGVAIPALNGFSVITDGIAYDVANATGRNSYYWKYYSFFKDKAFTVTFELSNIVVNSGVVNIHIFLGKNTTVVSLDGSVTEQSVGVELTADDNLFYIQVDDTNQDGTFDLKNLEVKGVLIEDDDLVQTLILKKLLSYGQATRVMLERMRDSTNFPKVSDLPEPVLREFLERKNEFNSYQGTELGNNLLFYFFGYQVYFEELYFYKDDYPAENYPFIAQKYDDTFISGTTIYGKAASTQNSVFAIEVLAGHTITVGDVISNQTTPFLNLTRKVTKVVDNLVYVDEVCSVQADDLIDIYRVYKYAVNPDPSNYAKSPYIDVYFLKQYSFQTTLDFVFLKEFLYKYLPINVVIRNFGYKTTILPESFKISESPLNMGTGEALSIGIGEAVTMPTQTEIFVCWDDATPNDTDIYGSPVDNRSLVIEDEDYSYVYIL